MIEMRYKVERIKTTEAVTNNGAPVYGGGVTAVTVVKKTLQYREMQNIEEIGIQEPIWSEWADVPEVEEH